MKTEKPTVKAVWDDEQCRYVVDPSESETANFGSADTSGWWSEDGDNWLTWGGDFPADDSNFYDVRIALKGGPRDGEVVA